MKQWLAIVVIGIMVALFGKVSASHSHFFKRHNECCLPCAPECTSSTIGCDASWAGSAGSGDADPGTTPAAGGPTSPATGPGTKPPTPPPPTLPTPTPQPKLHVLLLVDDMNQDAGVANAAGAAALENVIRAGVSAHRLGTVETLIGQAVTPDRIKAKIAALPVTAQDTLFCLYSGAMEYEDNSRSYILAPAAAGRARMPRNDLRSALVARKLRLTGLFTDAPTNRVKPDMLPPFQTPTGMFSIEKLVFDNRGVMDVHASSTTELAFPQGADGGIFTLALVQELGQLKPNAAAVPWADFFDRVRKTTDRMFVDVRRAVLASDKVSPDDKRAYRDQTHQTPTAMTPLDQVQPAPRTNPQSATSPKPAELLVRVPTAAIVFIEDRPTTQAGAVRLFETAELAPGRDYTYSVRAEMQRGGRTVNESKRVTVRAGEVVELQFD